VVRHALFSGTLCTTKPPVSDFCCSVYMGLKIKGYKNKKKSFNKRSYIENLIIINNCWWHIERANLLIFTFHVRSWRADISLYVVCVYVIINSSIKLFLCYVGHVRFVRYTNMPARLDVLVVGTLRLHVIHSHAYYYYYYIKGNVWAQPVSGWIPVIITSHR
jgi:hypothetical protein